MQITIKRRLFISNILMIVIPVVLSLLLAVSAAALMWQQLSPETYPAMPPSKWPIWHGKT